MNYDFECKKCEKVHNIEMKMSEVGEKKIVCPDCGEEMKRIYSMPSVKYIGPGFYANEYKTQNIGGGMQLRHK